jgi:hypothetical protein
MFASHGVPHRIQAFLAVSNVRGHLERAAHESVTVLLC